MSINETNESLVSDEVQQAYVDLLRNNPTVAACGRLIDSGMSETEAMKTLIVLLCQRQDELIDELHYFRRIAPQVIRIGGVVKRMDVPTHYIRETGT